MGWITALLCLPLASAGEFPVPPLQTDSQLKVWAAKAQAAKKASDAASVGLVSYVGKDSFQAQLAKCCPDAAAMSPEAFLARFRAEARVAEIAHAFPADGPLKDETIEIAENYTWFVNEWQANMIGGHPRAGTAPQNGAEQALFGCKPFVADYPSWEEATSRLIYTAYNFRQLDTGSTPNYGPVTAVFSNARINNMVLISPVDTGGWQIQCNDPGTDQNFTCKAWDPTTVGTLQHFDHIVRPSLEIWGDGLTNVAKFFARSAMAGNGNYSQLSSMSSDEAERYWEANILGNPRFPEDVKFLIGDFASLFGTPTGQRLQGLADTHDLPLFWALGYGGRHLQSGPRGMFSRGHLEFQGNERLLDPTVSQSRFNATLPGGAQGAFKSIWSIVSNRRQHGEAMAPREYKQAWSIFKQHQVRAAPITAYSCGDAEACVGTDVSTGDCICKQTGETIV